MFSTIDSQEGMMHACSNNSDGNLRWPRDFNSFLSGGGKFFRRRCCRRRRRPGGGEGRGGVGFAQRDWFCTEMVGFAQRRLALDRVG